MKRTIYKLICPSSQEILKSSMMRKYILFHPKSLFLTKHRLFLKDYYNNRKVEHLHFAMDAT